MDIAKVVTHIGSSPVTAALVTATAIFAGVRRRPIEAVSLVAGWLLVFVAVHITKVAYDRARPPEGLVDTFNAAYPSGHSAYAIALIACATVLVRAGVGWAVRIAAVTVRGDPRRGGRRHAHLPARALPHRRARRLALAVAIWSIVGVFALFAGRVRHNVGPRMSDDEKTYLIAGAAAAISLIAGLGWSSCPPGRSYWRVRDRLVATLLSVYVLAGVRARRRPGVGAARALVLHRPALVRA